MTADGWIPHGNWKGNEPPIPGDAEIEVKFANGKISARALAKNWGWLNNDDTPGPYQIVAYRLAQPAAQERTISTGYFYLAVGRPPQDDDMDRSNCKEAGTMGHSQCGWCLGHDKPRFICGCALNLPLPTRAAGPSDADQRGAAEVGPAPAIAPVSDLPQSAPHPYRSRNGYGLRIREADETQREPLLISYDVFRRMK